MDLLLGDKKFLVPVSTIKKTSLKTAPKLKAQSKCNETFSIFDKFFQKKWEYCDRVVLFNFNLSHFGGISH